MPAHGRVVAHHDGLPEPAQRLPHGDGQLLVEAVVEEHNLSTGHSGAVPDQYCRVKKLLPGVHSVPFFVRLC